MFSFLLQFNNGMRYTLCTRYKSTNIDRFIITNYSAAGIITIAKPKTRMPISVKRSGYILSHRVKLSDFMWQSKVTDYCNKYNRKAYCCYLYNIHNAHIAILIIFFPFAILLIVISDNSFVYTVCDVML